MGQVPQPETNRDESLIKDYLLEKNGGWVYKVAELGVKYARLVDGKKIPLTASRIAQILKKHGVPRTRIRRRK